MSIDMNCAGSAQRYTAAKLGSCQTDDVTQNPKEWHVVGDINLVLLAVDFQFRHLLTTVSGNFATKHLRQKMYCPALIAADGP